ncbi:MAG: GNAT family N-acetyltransferase [Chloroflexi bacterium]|nr:MAG: GNAT family N-acetyltransferase [Chloroflexota bacterium]
MRSSATSPPSTFHGSPIGWVWPRTTWPAGLSARCSVAGLGVPKPDLKNALEVGHRVFLREPTARDRQQIVALNRVSRAFHRGWVTPPIDSEGFARWIRRCRQANVKCLLVCRLADGAIVGVFTLSQIVRGMFHSAYLGYYAQRSYAGQGYMTEGMSLVLRHAFRGMKLHRIEANVQPENVASIALVKRSGFRFEGFSPRYLKVAGRWRDHQRWAILIDDWRRLRRPRRAPSPGRGRQSRRGSLSPDRPR